MSPLNEEKFFDSNTLLVSKTDKKGVITYVNQAFVAISGYSEKELLGQPHNIIRHPDMPKVIFKFLWQHLLSGQEIHAYVKNRTKDGGFYWALANVTPSMDLDDRVIGFHSARRKPSQSALEKIIPLYQKLLEIERDKGITGSEAYLNDYITKKGMDYDEFILSI